MLKASIAAMLALSAVTALAGCTGKKDESAGPGAPGATAPATPPTSVPTNHPAARPSGEVDLGGIARAEGGKTVAEVYAEKDALANRKVAVRGKVVKVNAGVMNMDWVHVRDGSGAEGSNDLTVTTKSLPTPKIGDTVVVTGTVTLDKDFGMGYQYPVLIEGADVRIEGSATP